MDTYAYFPFLNTQESRIKGSTIDASEVSDFRCRIGFEHTEYDRQTYRSVKYRDRMFNNDMMVASTRSPTLFHFLNIMLNKFFNTFSIKCKHEFGSIDSPYANSRFFDENGYQESFNQLIRKQNAEGRDIFSYRQYNTPWFDMTMLDFLRYDYSDSVVNFSTWRTLYTLMLAGPNALNLFTKIRHDHSRINLALTNQHLDKPIPNKYILPSDYYPKSNSITSAGPFEKKKTTPDRFLVRLGIIPNVSFYSPQDSGWHSGRRVARCPRLRPMNYLQRLESSQLEHKGPHSYSR